MISLFAVLACTTEPPPPVVPPPPPAPVKDPRPNVLILLWDTTRADHLSVYGYDKPTTPKLEALAAEATVYERATPVGMWTLPTHTAMFTGLAQTSHSGQAAWLWLDDQHVTLAEMLDEAGYETFAFSANIVVGPWTNLTQGFERVYTTYPKFKKNQPGKQMTRYMKAAKAATTAKLIPEDASVELSPAFAGSSRDKWAQSVFKDGAPIAADALSDFLDERDADPELGSKPFFAYVNMMEAHSPRIPSAESRAAVMTPEQVALGLKTDSSLYALNEFIIGKREYTPEETAAITGIYDASLRDLDNATSTMIEDLRTRGVLDDTVVIVVADHGEALGEHRLYEHRWSMYEQLLHVPLIIRYPAKFQAGERIMARVSTADLFATITELTGTPAPQETESVSLVGRGVGEPYVFAQLLDPFADQLTSMMEVYPKADFDPWKRTYCVAYEDQWKLIYASDDHHLLFDLAADPTESSNQYASAKEQVAELEGALRDWESKLPVYDSSRRNGIEKKREKVLEKMGRVSATGTDEEKQKLIELGYAMPEGGDWPFWCGPYGKEQAAKAGDAPPGP